MIIIKICCVYKEGTIYKKIWFEIGFNKRATNQKFESFWFIVGFHKKSPQKIKSRGSNFLFVTCDIPLLYLLVHSSGLHCGSCSLALAARDLVPARDETLNETHINFAT